MLHHALSIIEEASEMTPYMFFFVFVSQMRIPTGENFPVAETFMNNVANSVSRNTKRSFQLSNTQTSVCTAASKSCTGSVDVEG